MITKLTAEQEARFAEFRDEWTGIGLSTQPADRPRAAAAMAQAYAAASLTTPRFVWCGSPMSQGLTRAIVMSDKLASVGASVRDSVWDSVGASVGASVRASVRDSVRDSVRASVGDSVWDSVGASVGASVRDSVWASVGDSVGASVGDSVRASVGDSVRDSVRASVGDSVYGQHEAAWLGFIDFFRRVCGLHEQTEKLIGLTEYARSAGWALPHAKLCWLSERHSELKRDDRGRLHNPKGPAVEYPDGWRIYAVHGVRMPADVFEDPHSLSVSRIDAEKNAEVRRVMLDRFGPSRFLLESGSKLIHSDDYGSLYRRDLNGDEPLVMVKVVNSTPEPDGTFKDYFLRVPPQMTRAREAVAWTFDVKESEYEPVIQS